MPFVCFSHDVISASFSSVCTPWQDSEREDHQNQNYHCLHREIHHITKNDLLQVGLGLGLGLGLRTYD